MVKKIFLFLFIGLSAPLFSQVHGFIKDSNGNILPGALVKWLDTTVGGITDSNGHFHISSTPPKAHLLVASSLGFASDTIDVAHHNVKEHLNIILKDNTILSDVIVTQRRQGKYFDRLSPLNIESLNANELKKAACCNLSESFETNPSVDVSYSDAATGAKQIKLLGLSGGYVQMLTENIPNLRGLSSAYGMGFIPGPWMESIQISKGVASVRNGYEAIAGQINVEYKKPQDSNPLSINLFTNSAGRVEANADAAININESLATSILLHASDEYMNLDHNKDDYMDLPRIKQYNVANRWYYNKDNYTFQAFVKGLSESRMGGQITGPYKIGIDTERYEFFVKNGFMFGEDEHDHKLELDVDHEHDEGRKSSLGIIVNGTYHNQKANYGLKNYNGQQNNIYANILYDTELGKLHRLSVGSSFNVDTYDELLLVPSELPFSPKRVEYVPGAFAEYTFNYKDLSALAGIRTDYNSVFGTFISPRFHLRYNLMNMAHLRVAAGKGYRTPNVLAENNFLLASNRKIEIANNLKQEEAWNLGATAHIFIPIWSGREMSLMAEFFYTTFGNQVVADMDSNPHIVSFANLDGISYSKSLQFETNIELIKGLTATLAHRINDVKTTINGVLREKPLTNRSKSLITLSYQTPLNKWQFDFTSQFNGGGRLPDPDVNNPKWEKEFKPFTILNGQITKNFKTWSVYVGGENLTNFIQENPIISVNNPFSNEFDASMVWGPMHGRTIYAGMRWAINKK